MEYCVDEGGVGNAKVEGYKVGGKTGTVESLKPEATVRRHIHRV